MAKIELIEFDGLVPRLSPTLLPPSNAQVADNARLHSKELRAYKGATAEYLSADGFAGGTAYRLYNADRSASNWLSWAAEGVSVVASPTPDTTESRVIISGANTKLLQTNYTLAFGGAEPYPSSFQYLGAPRPASAPSLTLLVNGPDTEEAEETRAYVYTYVNTFGTVSQEGAPSDPTNLDLRPTGSTVRISGFAAPPTTGYNITHIRVYRTVVGDSTVSYQLVDEITVGTTQLDDANTSLQLGDVISTEQWDVPPDDLEGLVAMPGGVLAAFTGNTVYFCEPYYPHAWPFEYGLTVPAKIVGLAVMGSSLVVMTTATPYFIHGGVPGSMSMEQVQLSQPCLNRMSIAMDESAVYYVSPKGLVGLSPGERAVLTDNLFAPEDWDELEPATIVGAVTNGRYYASVRGGDQSGYTYIFASDGHPACVRAVTPATGFHVDNSTGELFYIAFGNLYKFAGSTSKLTYTWRSKTFSLPTDITLSCLRMDADFTGTVTVKVYADGVLASTTSVTDGRIKRLAPFKARDIEVQIEGSDDVRSVALATTVSELRA